MLRAPAAGNKITKVARSDSTPNIITCTSKERQFVVLTVLHPKSRSWRHWLHPWTQPVLGEWCAAPRGVLYTLLPVQSTTYIARYSVINHSRTVLTACPQTDPIRIF
jgi:hypothetical protein